MKQYEWRVGHDEAGRSLLEFLQARLEDRDFSRRKIKGYIDAGYCFIQGKPERFSKARVLLGSSIQLRVPEVRREELTILYEDEALLVLNKPAGTTCDVRLEKSLHALGKKAYLVHRLDKDTTGVLLVAKTIPIRDQLMAEFQERTIEKRYVAIVTGRIAPCGVVENYLAEIMRAEGKVKWGEVKAGGHWAYTEWVCKMQTSKASFVELKPQTGRTHQLRVHLAGIGHPIIGDLLYGTDFRIPASRCMLHAFELSFLHPVNKEKKLFQAPLPRDMLTHYQSLFGGAPCIS